jgi:hypothetical protein
MQIQLLQRIAVLITIVLLGYSTSLSADSFRQGPYCDTLYTNDGKMYLVRIIEELETEIRFSMCGDASASPFILDRTLIKRIGRRDQSQVAPMGAIVAEDPTDPLVKSTRSNLIMSVLANVFMYTIFLTPVGLVLALISVVRGEKLLRKLQNHPFERYLRKRARNSVIWGMLAIIIPILLLFVIGI